MRIIFGTVYEMAPDVLYLVSYTRAQTEFSTTLVKIQYEVINTFRLPDIQISEFRSGCVLRPTVRMREETGI